MRGSSSCTQIEAVACGRTSIVRVVVKHWKYVFFCSVFGCQIWMFEHYRPNVLFGLHKKISLILLFGENVSLKMEQKVERLHLRTLCCYHSEFWMIATAEFKHLLKENALCFYFLFCSTWGLKQRSIPPMRPCIHNIKWKALTSRTMALLIWAKQSAYSQRLTFTDWIRAVHNPPLLHTRGMGPRDL